MEYYPIEMTPHDPDSYLFLQVRIGAEPFEDDYWFSLMKFGVVLAGKTSTTNLFLKGFRGEQ